MFSAETYKFRRRVLMDRIGRGLILLYGNGESPINFKANTYRFRQDSSFLYYTGLDRPDLAVLLDAETGNTYLCGEDYTLEDIVWMGQQRSLAELASLAGLDRVVGYASMQEILAKAGKQNIHYLPPYRCEHEQKLTSWLGVSKKAILAGSSKDLIKAVVAQRSLKSEAEVKEIEKALKLSKLMHETLMAKVAAGQSAKALLSDVREIPFRYGGRMAYEPIFTTDGQILHNHRYEEKLEAGKLLLCDMGAEVASGYASDITRTYPVSDNFTQRQKALYELVLAAEERAIKACRPGRPFRDIHLLAARVLVEGLKEMGLMKGAVDEAVSLGAHALFFPHGLGHMMGLDVHDMENLGEDDVGYDEDIRRSEQFGLAYLRLARPLQAGFVLTVEPGVYFIPALIEQWKSEKRHADFICYEEVEKYLDFGGIRIEDNVFITEDGYRVLGDSIAKKVEDIKNLRLSIDLK